MTYFYVLRTVWDFPEEPNPPTKKPVLKRFTLMADAEDEIAAIIQAGDRWQFFVSHEGGLDLTA